MPEFIADTDGTVNGMSFDDLSDIFQGYVEAMLFTETCSGISMVDWNDPKNVEDVEEGRADGSIPTDAGWGDIHPNSAERMQLDCFNFEVEARDLLAQAYRHTFPARTIGDGTLPDSHREAWDYDAKAAGRDFWYTRNGHGVGFWDRGLGDIGDKLAEIARKYGTVNVSFGPDESSPTGYGYVYAE
jgi:hypothetical protein